MTKHKQVHITELSADIDEGIVELLQAFNRIPNVRTISSCQGDPGEIEIHGGAYGHVTFNKGDWPELCDFCFARLAPLVSDLWDDVRIEITVSETFGRQFHGWLRFRHECIAELVAIIQGLRP